MRGGIVGLPSSKKSPAIGVALKPLERLIGQAQELYRSEQAAFEADQTIFEVQENAIKARMKKTANDPKKGNLNDLGKELQTHREQEPVEPTPRRYKSNDTTIEKLGELLRTNPAGMLVLRDELVGLMVSWDREGHEGDRAFYLEAWNGDSRFETDRIGRGSILIPNLCVSLFGGIQPDKLITYLDQAAHSLANDGMLQRFQLLVYPNPIAWEWRDRKAVKEVRDHVFTLFKELAHFKPEDWGAHAPDDESKFPYFHFDPEAQQIFINWSEDLHCCRIPSEESPLIAQHLEKYDKLFPALALIFHLVECQASSLRSPITADAARRAAAWCEYLEAHARRCYGLLMDDGLRAAKTLAEKLQQGKFQDGFTARDVKRHQWRYLNTPEAVQAALDWLEDEHWLKEDNQEIYKQGRPTRRYLINPTIKKLEKSGESGEKST